MSKQSITPHNLSDISVGLAANTAAAAGEIACLNASGWAVPGSATTGLRALGVFNRSVEAQATNGAAEASVATSKGKQGLRLFPLRNSATAPIGQAHVLKPCYIEDANTAAATDAGGTLSRAGKVWGFDRDGNVLVEFDVDFDADVATLQADVADLQTEVAGIRTGSVTLASGTATVNLAGISSASRITLGMTDPGAGAITGLAGFRIQKAADSFTVTAIDDAKATLTTAVCVLDYVAVG